MITVDKYHVIGEYIYNVKTKDNLKLDGDPTISKIVAGWWFCQEYLNSDEISINETVNILLHRND